VAARIRAEFDLPTLRIRIAPDVRREITAAFEVLRGKGIATTVATVPTRSIGLSDRIRSARDISESRFALDSGVVSRIAAALHDLATDVPAYWLELPAPRGYLQLVPWEHLLSDAIGKPLLRLPSFTLRPNAPGPALRVIIAAGLAVGTPAFDVAGLVAQVAGTWSRSVDREVLIDIFVDAESFPGVSDRTAGLPGVFVHDPGRAPAAELGDSDEVAGRPWVKWVSSALDGKAVDVVHLLSHGHISRDRGALVLPVSPTATGSDRLARFIGPVLMCDALDRLGAWSLLVSAVPENHCQPGLRDLADAVSQARAGVVVLHRMGASDSVAELGPALEMIFAGRPQFRPLPGITCWSHPAFVAFPATDSVLCDQDGTSALISGATNEVLAQTDTPAWVAAGTRVLETLQAEWTPADGSVPDPQTVAALQKVSKLFDEHVQAHALTDHESAAPTDPGGTS
jgi:hypothetical protein